MCYTMQTERKSEMIFRDKYGWPVERIKGKHLSNFFRLLFLTNIRQTIKRRESGKDGTSYQWCEKDAQDEEVKQDGC
jgi:hypothetical protein